MKTAAFQYKCRLCGEVYANTFTGEQNALIYLVCAIDNKLPPKQFIEGSLDLISTHVGCEKGHGVSDLIGYIITEE